MLFPQGKAPAGKQTLTFSMQLPTDLASSMIFGAQKNVMMLSISYKLVAEFVQIDSGERQGTSSAVGEPDLEQQSDSLFKTEQKIFVLKQIDSVEVVEVPSYAKYLTSEVGGFLGAGKTSSSAKFSMDRTDYYAAEKVRVRINVDNTQCKKDVKEIKIKLARKVTAIGDGRVKIGEKVEHIDIIGDYRFGGL